MHGNPCRIEILSETPSDEVFRHALCSVSIEAAVRENRSEWQEGPRRPFPALYRKRAPKGSNLGAFGKGKRVLHVDPEIAHCILDLAVAEKDLDSP